MQKSRAKYFLNWPSYGHFEFEKRICKNLEISEKILKIMFLSTVIEDKNRGYYFYVTLIVFLERLNSALKWN